MDHRYSTAHPTTQQKFMEQPPCNRKELSLCFCTPLPYEYTTRTDELTDDQRRFQQATPDSSINEFTSKTSFLKQRSIGKTVRSDVTYFSISSNSKSLVTSWHKHKTTLLKWQPLAKTSTSSRLAVKWVTMIRVDGPITRPSLNRKCLAKCQESWISVLRRKDLNPYCRDFTK